MAGQIFSQVTAMTETASVAILVVLGARILLKRAPKVYSYTLWSVVLFRLLCPVSVQLPVSLIPDIGQVSTSIQESTASDVMESSPEWLQILPWLWLAGVALMALFSFISHLRLRRKLSGATRLRDNLYLADHIAVPFVFGVLRPRIYLPSRLREEENEHIIAHECHHIRRLDHIWRPLSYIALCLHWFNPLVWAAFILAGRDMEMSCDEAVLRRLGTGVRGEYARSILALSTAPRPTDTSPAFGGCNTKERLINMANWKKPKPWVSILAALFCLCILAGCAVDTADPQTTAPANIPCADPACTDTTHEHNICTDVNCTDTNHEHYICTDANCSHDTHGHIILQDGEAATIEYYPYTATVTYHHNANNSHHQEEHHDDHHS